MTRIAPVILLMLLVCFSCERNQDDRVFYQEDLIDIAGYIEKNKEKFNRFYDIMNVGELTDPLSAYNPAGDGSFTLFLPTDEAFDRYIQNNSRYSSFHALIQDISFVRELGRYHLVSTGIRTNYFPYGALPDTTATGDMLTIGFSSDLDTTIYKVNNIAPVIIANLEMVNGYIHVIGEVLEPVNFTGYEWLAQNPGYTILSEALKLTGLKDTLSLYITTNKQVVKNMYTILAEHDSIYSRYGIHSIEDLIGKYGTPGKELTDIDNSLYQFTAYHILERSFFLDEFEGSENYNTYANFPSSINAAGLEIRINQGVDTFSIKISGGDTTWINYIRFFYQESNVLTKNGPIHFISDVMELFNPPRIERTFQFREEPAIDQASETETFIDPDKFVRINWSGTDYIIYVRQSGTSENAKNPDYIRIEGNFTIEYTMPKILPGRYALKFRAHAFNMENATVQVYLDGKRIGGNYDLTSGGDDTGYKIITVGEVDFGKYSEHTIKIRALIPGIFIWDFVNFTPQ